MNSIHTYVRISCMCNVCPPTHTNVHTLLYIVKFSQPLFFVNILHVYEEVCMYVCTRPYVHTYNDRCHHSKMVGNQKISTEAAIFGCTYEVGEVNVEYHSTTIKTKMAIISVTNKLRICKRLSHFPGSD